MFLYKIVGRYAYLLDLLHLCLDSTTHRMLKGNSLLIGIIYNYLLKGKINSYSYIKLTHHFFLRGTMEIWYK